MATEEEILRLVLEAQTTAFVSAMEKVKAELTTTKEEIYEFADAYDVLETDTRKFENTVVAQASTIKRQGDSLEQLESKARRASSGMAGFGQSMLQTGRIVQDFTQGGIAGVLNNIEGFIQAIGGGPGLSGVLTVLGVGLFLLKDPIKDFIASLNPDAISPFTSEIEELQDRIKEIEKQPLKLGVDLAELDAAKERLNDLKKAQQELDAARAGMSKEEHEVGKEITKILKDEGDALKEAEREITTAITGQMAARDKAYQANTKAANEARAAIGKQQAAIEANPLMQAEEMQARTAEIESAQKRLAEAEDAMNARIRQLRTAAGLQTGEMLAGAKAGNVPQAQADLIGWLRQVGQQALAGKIAGAPAAIETREAEKEHLEVVAKEQKKAKEFWDDLWREIAHDLGMAKQETAQARREAAAFNKDLAARQREHLDVLGDEQQAAKKRKRQEDAAAANAANAHEKMRAAQAKGLTGLQGQAENLIAQGVASGQVRLGAEGRLSPADFIALSNMIAAELRRNNPGGNRLAQSDIAARVAENAEKNLGLTADVVQNQAIIANRFAQMQAQMAGVQNGARQVRRQLEMPGPINLPAGGQ